MNNKLTIAAIFRDESMILEEWLEHYKVRGVDHIFLINDGSKDSFEKILKPYIDSGFVSMFNCQESRDLMGRQNICYNNILRPLFPSMDWLLLIDLDEFVWNTEHPSLKAYLNKAELKGVDTINIFMDDFGSSGMELQPPSVVESFTHRAKRPKKLSNLFKTKSLVRVKNIKTLGFVSTRTGHEKRRINLEEETIRLNHYKFQSRERWEKVVLPRGSANAAEHIHRRHSDCFWRTHDARCNKVEDFGLIKQNEKYGCKYKT